MINCIYTGGTNNEEFERFQVIINEKYDPAKECLLSIQNRVQTGYDIYLNNFQSIELLASSEFESLEINEKEYLKKCYTSETQNFKNSKRKNF